MKSLAQLGRYFFAIPFCVFGIQYFLYGHYAGGLSPVPPWAPGGAVGAYLIGAFLVIAAISVLANWNARLFAVLLGLVYLLCVLLLHSQHLSDIIYNGRERTRALELSRSPALPWSSPDAALRLPRPPRGIPSSTNSLHSAATSSRFLSLFTACSTSCTLPSSPHSSRRGCPLASFSPISRESLSSPLASASRAASPRAWRVFSSD